MNRRWLGAGLLTLLALTGQAAESARLQPLLLPMAQLLKQLDQQQEWLMLPLADYQALVAAGRRPTPAEHGQPAGAWVETARLSGMLVDDRTLRLEAVLEVVAVVGGPSRCRLFARLPDALGSATLAGGPALTVARDDGGLDLLLPGPGRHQALVTWTVELVAAAGAVDGALSGSVPLPLAAGLAATLASGTPGELVGAGLGPLADQWTVTRPSGSELALTWHPGRRGGDAQAVWGAAQALQMAVPDELSAPRAWRWSATPSVLRGQLPTLLNLHLPHGWTATGSGSGVLEVTQVADGVLLRIDPAASELALDGIAAADAAVALPALDGAAWQGGRVVLTNAGLVDWRLPPRWQRLPVSGDDQAATAGWRAFAVPGPDAGLQLAPTATTDGLATYVSTTVAIGAERWRMEATLEIQAGSVARFTVPVRLPAGWRAVSASCSVPARIAGADAGGALSDTPADGVLRIALPQGLKPDGALTIGVVLERDALAGPQPLTPPGLDGAERIRHQLVIASAPSLDLLVSGGGWQRATAVTVTDASAARVVRTVLDAVGEAPALTLTATAKPAACEAEAVAWLLPIEGQEAAVWCRLDLRLTVSDGELDTLALSLPLVPGTVQLADPALALVRDGARTLLHASRPWRGERLVRIEGRLADVAGARIAFPRVGVTRADGRPVPTVLHVALQAPERLDLHLEPGAAAQAEDEDDLPHWSRAIPGDPLAGVWRIDAGKAAGGAGGFALVSRALVDPPAGFVHHLELRTQLTAERALTLVRFRLAAPGLAALALQLPAGTSLVAATLDGHAVAVRRSAGDAVLPLPGRTQVAVALLLAAPQGGGAVDLRLPGLGGLPVTGLSWLVAADVAWRITPLDSPEIIHLTPSSGEVVRRPWFAAWRAANGVVDADATALPVEDAAIQVVDDARRLTPPAPSVVADGEPTLALVGQLWQGERLGGNARVAFLSEPLSGLRRSDHLGAALAVLLGVWLAWRLRPLASGALAAAALCTAATLHAVGWSCGPLLALSEWLAPVLVVVVLIRLITAARPVALRRVETAP